MISIRTLDSGLPSVSSSKSCAVRILSVFLSVLLAGCDSSEDVPQSRNRSDYHSRIIVREVRHSVLFMPVHAGSGDYNSLVLDGQEFRNLGGLPPYYIDIAAKKRIVFVTGAFNWSIDTIHVYDFPAKRHWQFRLGPYHGSFGGGIGEKITGERSLVEKASEKELVLLDESLSVRTMRRFVLDLGEEKIKQVEWIVYDDTRRNITNSYIAR